MQKHLVGFICAVNVCAVLLCVGLLFYNMTEMKKLSVQYSRLEENVRQFMDEKYADMQNENQDEIQDEVVFSLEGYSYLVNESVDVSEIYPQLLEEQNEAYENTALVRYSYLVNEYVDISGDD